LIDTLKVTNSLVETCDISEHSQPNDVSAWRYSPQLFAGASKPVHGLRMRRYRLRQEGEGKTFLTVTESPELPQDLLRGHMHLESFADVFASILSSSSSLETCFCRGHAVAYRLLKRVFVEDAVVYRLLKRVFVEDTP
jgi:hypothetical protein